MADLLAKYRIPQAVKPKTLTDLKQEIEHKQVTQPFFLKALGQLGAAFNVPLNIAFNRKAEESGMEKVPIFSTHLDFSDVIETYYPEQRENLEWQKYKPLINFASSFLLDPTTYTGFGALTKGGKISHLAKGGKIAPALDATGQVRKIGDEILWTLGKNKDGSVKYLNEVPKDIAKNKSLYEQMDKAGYLKTEIPKLGQTLAERIKEGQQAILSFNPNPLGAFGPGGQTAKIIPFKNAQIAVAEKLGKVGEKIATNLGPVGRSLRLSGLIKLEGYLRRVGLDNVANGVRDLEIIPASLQKEFFDQAVSEAADIKNIASKIRNKFGAPADDIADEAVGLTRKEMDAFNTAAKYGDLGANGVFEGKVFNVKAGNIVGETVNKFLDLSDTLGKDWKNTHGELLDYAVNLGKKTKTGITAKIKESLDAAGIQSFLQGNYIKQLDLKSLTKDTAGKFAKNSKLLTRIISTIFGKGRSWKGFSLEETGRHRASIYNILSNPDFEPAEKVAGLLLHDQRLASGIHTIGDLLSLGSRSDIDSLIDSAIKSGDDALFETYESAKKMAGTYNELVNNNLIKKIAKEEGLGETGLKALFYDAKKINTSDLINKARVKLVDDLYLANHPALNYFTKTEAHTRIKEINFLNNLVTDGIKNDIVRLIPESELAEGYKKINLPGFMTFSDKKLAEFYQLGVKPTTERYKMMMRDDVWQAFKGSNLEKFVKDPAAMNNSHLGDVVMDWAKGAIKLWRVTTLFPFAAFYARNIYDNSIKTFFDYVNHGNIKDLPNDFRKAVRMVNANTKDTQSKVFQGFVDMVKGKAKDTDIIVKDVYGKEWTARELWDTFLDEGVMGRGVTEFGILNKNAIVTMIKKLEKSGVVDTAKLSIAKKLKEYDDVTKPVFEAASKSGERVEKIIHPLARPGEVASRIMKARIYPIEQMIHIGEYSEAVFRMNVFMNKLRHMPLEEAVKQTKLVAIDYSNLSKFERNVMQQLFPFWSFRKGTIKYLSGMALKNPVLMKNIIPSAFEFSDTSIYSPEERIQRGVLAPWLQEATLRTGYDEENDVYKVFNLKGFSSIAEVIAFAQPFNTLGADLFPAAKGVLSIIANRDFQTKGRLERYAGEKDLVFGIPIRRGAEKLTAPAFAEAYGGQLLKSIRMLGTVERVTESVLKNTDVSIFGTPKKRSWMGLGRISDRDPEKLSTVVKRTLLGMPYFEVNLEKTKRNYFHSLKGEINKNRHDMNFVKYKYRGDPEVAKKETLRLYNETLKIITKHKKTRVDKLTDKDLGMKR